MTEESTKQAKHLADELNEDREGEEETKSGWEAQSEGKRTKTRRIYRSLHLASLWEVRNDSRIRMKDEE